MVESINITNYYEDLERFADNEDLARFYRQYGCGGVELLRVGEGDLGLIEPRDVVGVHLRFFPCWVDLWNGDERGLLREFKSIGAVERFYGGSDAAALIRAFETDLAFAEQIGARYVVFHICDVSTYESYGCPPFHSDEQVIDASCDLINRLLDGSTYRFDFLMENLWWPGLTMKRPEMTRRLLDGVRYPKKGIMLDTGHFMNAHTELRTQEEGCRALHDMLDAHGDLCGYIRGIHLHQSLSGEYVKGVHGNPPTLAEEFFERYYQAYSHIFKVDMHQPFGTKAIRSVVDRIDPAYLTHEFITNGREQHETYLKTQTDALR